MSPSEHLDVLIVGAGLSGIGAAYHLQTQCPGKTLRDPRGRDRHRRHLGPVPLSRHPLRLRHVHARLFVPAVDAREGDRRRAVDPRLRARDGARATASTRQIRFRHRVERAAWSSGRRALDRRGASADASEPRALHVQLPASCAAATTTTTTATRRSSRASSAFAGRIVHPQNWPDDLDYAGKRVVVIGSGATAVTLVPEMAKTRRARDDAAALADLHRLAARPRTPSRTRCARVLPAKLAYALTRWKNVLLGMLFFQLSRRRPDAIEEAASSKRRAQGARSRLRRRHALHAALQPVGPAPVPRARRRSVRGDQARARVGRHRSDRDVHRDRASAALGQRARGRPDRHRDRARTCSCSAASQLTVDGARGRSRRRR